MADLGLVRSEASGYQWTIDEYVLRCELYGGKELIVEGDDDRRVLSDVLARAGVTDVSILDGSYFKVDDCVIDALGLSRGIKGKLLALANAVQARSAEVALAMRIVVVVDRDYDGVPEVSSKLVIATDGYSMESYAYSVSALDRLGAHVLGKSSKPLGAKESPPPGNGGCSGRDLLPRVAAASSSIAAVRRTLRSVASAVGVFDRWLGRVTVDPDGRASLDEEALLRDILAAEKVAIAPEVVSATLLTERDLVRSDGARYIRGHDFVTILHKVLKSSWGRRVSALNMARVDEDSFRRLLLFSIDPEELDRSPMARALCSRLA